MEFDDKSAAIVAKVDAMETEKERKLIENRISEIESELVGYKGDEFDKPLLDEDGFPREDLDYAKLRNYKLLKKELNGELNRKGERF